MNVDCPINSSVKIKFETDAANNYFDSHLGRGTYQLSHPSMLKRAQILNGICTFSIQPSLVNSALSIGDKIPFTVIIFEKGKNRFENTINITITNPIIIPPPPPPGPGIRKKKRKSYSRERKSNSLFDGDVSIEPPDIKGYSREAKPRKWEENFAGNLNKGARWYPKGGGKYQAIVNLSHPSLKEYQKKHRNLHPKKVATRHMNLVGIVSFAVYLLSEAKMIEYNKDKSITDLMEIVSDSVAFFGLDFTDKLKI